MKAIRFMDPGVIEYSEIPQPEIRDGRSLGTDRLCRVLCYGY